MTDQSDTSANDRAERANDAAVPAVVAVRGKRAAKKPAPTLPGIRTAKQRNDLANTLLRLSGPGVIAQGTQEHHLQWLAWRLETLFQQRDEARRAQDSQSRELSIEKLAEIIRDRVRNGPIATRNAPPLPDNVIAFPARRGR